jgi:NADPH:quinone reductase-like Zn-dependent oxidoreductase
VNRTTEFHVGDRVAGFHEMLMPGDSYVEYALVPANMAFLIPESVSLEGKSR